MLTNHETILGTLSTGESVPLLQADRRRHVYVVGMTGTGKTGLLLNLMHADLHGRRGLLLSRSPRRREPAHREPRPGGAPGGRDLSRPVRPHPHLRLQSPIGRPRGRARDRRREHRLGVQKHLGATAGARASNISSAIRCACCSTRAIKHCSGFPACWSTTTIAIGLSSAAKTRSCDRFWLTEYAAYDSRFRNEAIAPIQNKVGAFLANPFIRSILCQNSSTLKIPDVMNKGKVLIVNLSKGNLGTEPAHLFGALLITACSQAAEARRHMPEHERRDFTLYVDEFQNFATDSFASILSEARKWRLSLVAANQTISQLPEGLQHAVFGNAGTLVVFRVGALDAKRLAGELGMSNPATLTQTNNYQAWIKLMRDGAPMEPRLIETLAPPPPGARFAKVVAFAHATPHDAAQAGRGAHRRIVPEGCRRSGRDIGGDGTLIE